MSRHTPGPWHVVERASGQAFSIGVQVQTKGNLITTHYITHITDRPTQQAEADARLIAAAPQMLEALEWLCEAARALDEQVSTVHDKIVVTDAVSLLRLQNEALSAAKQAEAAIRAAKGEV